MLYDNTDIKASSRIQGAMQTGTMQDRHHAQCGGMKYLSVDATPQLNTYIVAVAKATAQGQPAEFCLFWMRFSLAGP